MAAIKASLQAQLDGICRLIAANGGCMHWADIRDASIADGGLGGSQKACDRLYRASKADPRFSKKALPKAHRGKASSKLSAKGKAFAAAA